MTSIVLYGDSCKNPAVADDNLTKKFRYGCFCGENYPDIQHPSHRSYRELTSAQRRELIAQYRAIEPYDDIDRVCQEHDICFIEHGKASKVCNDVIVERLTDIQNRFAKGADKNVTYAQCRDLAFDISSVFHTIFSPADDEDTIFDFGMLMINGAITVTTKMGQEAVDTISDENSSRYPKKGVKCNLK